MPRILTLGATAPATAKAVNPSGFKSGFINKINQVNGNLRNALKPLHPVIDRLPNPPPPLGASWKQTLKERPLDAVVALFAPIQHLVERVLGNCRKLLGGNMRIMVGLPGKQVPASMAKPNYSGLPRSAGEWCTRLDTANQLLVFAYYRPDILARAIPMTMGGDAKWVFGQLGQAGQTAAKLMGDLAKNLGLPAPVTPAAAKTVQQVADKVADTASKIQQALPPPPAKPSIPTPPKFFGVGDYVLGGDSDLWADADDALYGLGDGGLVSVPTAAGGASAAGGTAATGGATLGAGAATGAGTAAVISPEIVLLLMSAMTLAKETGVLEAGAEVVKANADIPASALPGGERAAQEAARSEAYSGDTARGLDADGGKSMGIPLAVGGGLLLLAGWAFVSKMR